MQMARATGEDAILSDQDLQPLIATFEGELIAPEDLRYEAARRVWNGLIDRRPGLIARCRSVADVRSVVNLAREQRLLVTVRGGGHQVAGTAVCDRGLVIDLGLMKGIEVDAPARLVRAQGGVVWGELDRATQAFGLATPGGEMSTTGIAGLTLGGGMGMLQRCFGLSCDNVESLEVVTADGSFVKASRDEHADLFWALRGGGRGLGVVTRFEYRLHPIGPEVMVSTVFYPFEQARQVFSGFRAFTRHAPDEVTSQLLFWTVPTHPALPASVHQQRVVIVIGLFAGPAEAGGVLLRPLSELARPAVDLSGPTTYVELQSGMDDLAPAGGRYYWKSLFFDRMSDESMGEIIARAASRPSPATLVVLRHLGGAVARVPEKATAYANRSAAYNLSLDASWSERHDDDANIEWTRTSWNRMLPHSTGGVYSNFAGSADEAMALELAAHGENEARLGEVRRRYDPQGVFAATRGGG